MREKKQGERGGDASLLLRWGILVLVLCIGGLLLASRAADDYTQVVGFLLAGFGFLLAFRLALRVTA